MKQLAIGVLVSGGLDSCALVAEMSHRAKRVWPIYVSQGLRWENVELYWLKKFLKAARIKQPLTVLAVPMSDIYGSHWSTGKKTVPGVRSLDKAVYLPGRNLA